MASETHFLNVDLDIESDGHVQAFAAFFEENAVVLSAESHFLSVESAGGSQTLAETLRSLIDLIETSPPEIRAAWDRCSRRSFNIGVQAGASPRYVELGVPADLVAAIAGLGGDIIVTVYAPVAERSEPA